MLHLKFEQEKLAEFFALGRDVGWDSATLQWKVRQLMDVKGCVPMLGELVDSLDPGMPLKWSGDRCGAPKLRENIVSSQGYKLTADHVLVTLGCQNANFLSAAALVSPGDEVLLEIPTWMHMRAVCRGLGARVKTIKRREQLGWKFDLDELRTALTPRIRLFYFCQPNNPTGATFSRSELEVILELAARVGTFIISDEVYRGLEWNGETSPVAAEMYDRAISTSSVSKTIGLDGLRIGWIVSQSRKILGECSKVKQYVSTTHISGIDELLCSAALQPVRFANLLANSRELGFRNREVVAEWMEFESHFAWVPPTGGFMAFPSFSLPIDSWSLCLRLLEEPYRLYVVPGICYDVEDHIRIGFGAGSLPPEIRAGLTELSHIASDLTSSWRSAPR